MSASNNVLSRLNQDEPTYFADCCVGISHRFVATLAGRLPRSPSLVLSVGSGSGLLESLILQATRNTVNVQGVEVPTCENKYLPSDRMLRVPSSTSVHSDALLAEVLMFVYPRGSTLMTSYLDRSVGGALQKVVWIGQRTDWPEAERVLLAAFFSLEVVGHPGLPEHELLAIASFPRPRGPRPQSVQQSG